MADDQQVEGQVTLPFSGIDQSSIPETQINGAVFTQGLVPLRFGEMVQFPGKKKLLRQGILPIRGIYQFGDQILIENSQQLVRYTNAEIFGGTETEPDLRPDRLQQNEIQESEEDMPIAIVTYQLGANNPGATINANQWTRVPFTNEVVPSGDIILDGSGNFTISNSVYPVNVRIEAQVCWRGNTATTSVAKLLLEENSGTLGSGPLIATGLNSGGCLATTAANNVAHLTTRFSVAASTQYRLIIRATQAGTFGTAINVGAHLEVYAQMKVLWESTTVPVADGTVTPVTTITTEGGIVTAVA